MCTPHTQYVDVVYGRSSFSPPLNALVGGHQDCAQRKPIEPEKPPAFGGESDWMDSVIVLSFGCFDLVTTRRRLSLLFPFSRYIVRMGITLVVPVASCSAPQYHEEEKTEKHSDDRRCCGMTHSCCKYRLCLSADAVVKCLTVYRVITFRVSGSPSSAVRISNLAFHALVG